MPNINDTKHKLTDKEIVTSADSGDTIFVNIEGAVKQITIKDALQVEGGIADRVAAVESEVDELNSKLMLGSNVQSVSPSLSKSTNTMALRYNINDTDSYRLRIDTNHIQLIRNIDGADTIMATYTEDSKARLAGLHHLVIKSSAVKTFTFKINITSRGTFMMFGEVNAYPLLATGFIKVTDQTTNCTTNPFDGGALTIDIQCTECDADGYSTVTVTFNRNIYGHINILSSYPMLAATS